MLQELRFAQAQERQPLSTTLTVNKVMTAVSNALTPMLPNIQENLTTGVNPIDGQDEITITGIPVLNRVSSVIETATAKIKIIGADEYVDLIMTNERGEEVLFELANLDLIITLMKAQVAVQ